MKPTRRDYCQFILSSQTNYTQTYFADHHPHFSHDAINRYLQDDNVTPEELWNGVKDVIEYDDDACLIFDDSVLDKNHAHKIDLVRLQYSGNAHRLIKGIGVVNCLYVNLRTGRYWVIDWRIYAPDEDQKTKLAHAKDMFDNAIHGKHLRFRTVLMDSWYATKELMKHIHASDKLFYCPLKSNRKVDDSGGEEPYKAVSELQWTSEQAAHGKLVKVHGFPGDFKLKLFRVAVENSRTAMDCDERLFSGFNGWHPRDVRGSLENRAISPGSQANAGHREVPVPIGTCPEKSYRLCDAGLGVLVRVGPRGEEEHLQHQKRDAIELHEAGTEKPIGTDGTRLK